MKRSTRIAAVGGATASLAIAGGVAYAVWTVTGSGVGGAGATVAQNVTLTEVSPTGPGASLYPGGPAGPIYFQATNPNPFGVTITGITWGTPTSSNTTTCANTNVSIDAAAPTTVSIFVPGNTTAGPITSISGVVDLSHNAPNGCQGVNFNVPMTITATQQ